MDWRLDLTGRFTRFRPRVEGDLDLLVRIIVEQHLASVDGRHHGRDALLSVDENLLASGSRAVLQLDVWVLPDDEITGGIAVIERVDQIAYLPPLPYEGTLYFRNGHLAISNDAKDVLILLTFALCCIFSLL